MQNILFDLNNCPYKNIQLCSSEILSYTLLSGDAGSPAPVGRYRSIAAIYYYRDHQCRRPLVTRRHILTTSMQHPAILLSPDTSKVYRLMKLKGRIKISKKIEIRPRTKE